VICRAKVGAEVGKDKILAGALLRHETLLFIYGPKEVQEVGELWAGVSV
jgi:hypothetical protein